MTQPLSTLYPSLNVTIVPSLPSVFLSLLILVGWLAHLFYFADIARNNPADIRPVLASYERNDVAKEFLERSIEYQK